MIWCSINKPRRSTVVEKWGYWQSRKSTCPATKLLTFAIANTVVEVVGAVCIAVAVVLRQVRGARRLLCGTQKIAVEAGRKKLGEQDRKLRDIGPLGQNIIRVARRKKN